MFFNSVPQLLFFQFYSWKNCCFVIYFDLFLMWLLRYQKTFLAFGIRLENEAKKKRKKLNFVFLNLLFVQRLFDIFFPRDLAKTVFYPCSFYFVVLVQNFICHFSILLFDRKEKKSLDNSKDRKLSVDHISTTKKVDFGVKRSHSTRRNSLSCFFPFSLP